MANEVDRDAPLTPGEKALSGCGLLSFLISLWAIGMLFGCTTADNTWRADGLGLSVSFSNVMIIYGEVNKIPPGGYFERTRAVDLRPFWQRWFTEPGTNSVAYSKIILDARLCGVTNSVEKAEKSEN